MKRNLFTVGVVKKIKINIATEFIISLLKKKKPLVPPIFVQNRSIGSGNWLIINFNLIYF